MAEPLYIDSNVVHHFTLDPWVPPSNMAHVTPDGVILYPDTYYHTGREFLIPAGGQVVAFLCHVPAHDHYVNAEECCLLKYIHDPWYVCTCLMLTNTHPNISLVVPAQCDFYSLVLNTSVEIMTVAMSDFFALYAN